MASSSDATRKRTKERPSKGAAASDAKGHDTIASPQKVCKDGETSWAEFDFESDPFVSPDGSIKPVVRKSKSKPSSEKNDEAKDKAKRTSKGEGKKSSRSKSSDDGGEDVATKKLSSVSPEIRSKSKASKTSDDKNKTESSSKLRNKSDTPSSIPRSRQDSPSAVSRRRQKAIEDGSSVFSSVKQTKAKRESSSRSCDGLETPTRRRAVPISDLNSSRTRAVQRADARKTWREAHGSSKESGSGDADDALDAKLQSFGRDEQRANLLDQSRKGPVRISSRMRSRRDNDESDSCYDNDDDDDDDFSVISASSKSFITNESPYSNRRVSCAGGYLPNDLNATPGRSQGRRASALGSSLDRAQLIYSLKPRDDDDDDDEKSVYTLPNGLGSSANNTNQFEIGRSSSTTRARRMSLSTPLVIPCVNGSNTDLAVNQSNEPNQRAEKTERKLKKGSSNDILSLSPSKSSKKSSSKDSKEASCDKTGVDKASSSSASGHGTYDSAVDDMLKNRRLRGARGDAPTKKVEEKPAAPSNRRMSLGMLTNFVNPNQAVDGRVRPNEAAMRRPSRI